MEISYASSYNILEEVVIINWFITKIIMAYVIMVTFLLFQNECTITYVTTSMLASPFKLNVRCNNKNQLFIFINFKFNLHQSVKIFLPWLYNYKMTKVKQCNKKIANKAMQSFNKRHKAQMNHNLNKKDDHKDTLDSFFSLKGKETTFKP